VSFTGQGILGVTGLVPMLMSDPNYINIAQIILVVWVWSLPVYARQNTNYVQQVKDNSNQSKDNTNWQKQENYHLKKEERETEQCEVNGSTASSGEDKHVVLSIHLRLIHRYVSAFKELLGVLPIS
jgi:hypothetical protein